MTKRLLIFALISESILGLSQDEVELVINKTRRVVAGAKPAMVRLTFHDCVGENLTTSQTDSNLLLCRGV